MIAIWYRFYCLIHCIYSYFILPSLISFMKRFVGRPWIQRFQLFATGAQRRGDGDAARSTFPSGSIRRLATRLVFTILMKGVYFRWVFFKCTFFLEFSARIKGPTTWSSLRYVWTGRLFNFQSLIHPGPGASRQTHPRRTAFLVFGRFVDIQKLVFLESLTGGMDSHIFLCSLHSHSHGECCSRCRWWSFRSWRSSWSIDLQKGCTLNVICTCSILFHFLRLGEESWNDMVCSHDHSIMLRHVLARVAHGA